MKNMKSKILLVAGASLFASGVWAQEQPMCLSTPETSLVIDAPQGGELKYVYYGAKLNDADLNQIDAVRTCNQAAYPVYGMNTPAETALSVCHADGNMSTQLVVESVATTKADKTQEVTVRLKDKVYPFYVNVCYRAYQDVDIIETWTEITNEEKKPVVLNQFASAYLPIRRGNVWLSSLYGSWANEGRLAQEPLEPGMKVIKNKDGVRNSHTAHAEVMFSLDGRPQENVGRTIGAALCYTGNYKLRIDTDDSEYHQFFAGINEENSQYHLQKGETFATPVLALTYSDEGLSGASRNFHRWGRTYKLAHGDKPRKILLNSWEGVYFDINQQGMEQMMADIESMGGELFVMDDGWFGDKYQRNSDNSSLGDWVVDTRKLPEGIEGLLRDAKKHHVGFGIWIEPEMSNTTSELYEKHPEWIVKAPQRDPVLGRGGTQVVLDLGNPEVQDFVFGVVDDLMSKYPEIEYIKWDANMAIMNHGSNYLTADNQSASGGGRANWGYLPWFDEFWVSDNTDALQRIYMQWGTSYFFPAIAMASHISSAPNHQVFRTVPIKYRIDVAMSGRLGMEIQPKNMTEEEKEICRKAIADYKMIRPVVQFGDYNQHLPRVRMAGLDPAKMYRVKELNRIDNEPLPFEGKSYSGKFLMENGLEIPYTHKVDYHKLNDYASRVLYLEEE